MKKQIRLDPSGLIVCLPLLALAFDMMHTGARNRGFVAYAQEEQGEKKLGNAKLIWLAIPKLTKGVETAARESKVELTPEAKDFIVKQLILERRIKGDPIETITVSPAEERDIAKLLAAAKKEKVNLETIESLLASRKIKQLAPNVSDQILKTSKLAGIKLNARSTNLIERDLMARINLMAKSNLPAEAIENNNGAYLNAIFAAAPAKVIGANAYAKARDTVFQRIVRLTIRSIPEGAEVEINGINVGKTVIEKKPMEAGYEYVFLFKLQGYKNDRRVFYVLPDQPTQEVDGFLLPE